MRCSESVSMESSDVTTGLAGQSHNQRREFFDRKGRKYSTGESSVAHCVAQKVHAVISTPSTMLGWAPGEIFLGSLALARDNRHSIDIKIE